MTKWPDFFFTLAVRFVCGVVLGAGACVIFTYRGILRAFSHDDTRAPLIVLCVSAFVGGVIAVFTTPHWQTPWYKGVRMRDEEDLWNF
jgi:hypothetical protein